MQINQLHVSDEDSYHVNTGIKAKIKLLKHILQVKMDMELVAKIILSESKCSDSSMSLLHKYHDDFKKKNQSFQMAALEQS